MNYQSAIIRNIHRFNRAQSLDRSFYTIIARASDGDIYAAERILRNPHIERDQLIEDIATGQIANVQTILEFNPSEGWSKECSEDIARQIFNTHGVTDACREFLEDQLGCAGMVS